MDEREEFRDRLTTGAIGRRQVIIGAAALAALPQAARAQAVHGAGMQFPADLNAEHPFDSLSASARPTVARSQRIREKALPPSHPEQGVRAADETTKAASSPVPTPRSYQGFQVIWADDDKSVDFFHLLAAERDILGAAAGVDTAFNLTPSVLQQICENNGFRPARPREAPFVLFGIRGATAPIVPADWTTSVEIRLAQPDHFTPKCLIGIWYRGADRPASLRLFPGSTVPNALYMSKQVRDAGDQSNLMPTGFHQFAVGHHDQLQGAFRQHSMYPTHRLPYKLSEQPWRNDLCFTNEVTPFSRPHLAGPIEIKTVDVNLHPARAPESSLEFSSAGCQVVVGDQIILQEVANQRATGYWNDFRKAAGLHDPPTRKDDRKPYSYLLVSGREALCAARASNAQQISLRRLRIGSADGQNGYASPFGSQSVRRLQDALIAACRSPGPLADAARSCTTAADYVANGALSPETMRLVMVWQKVNLGYADGIVDRPMLQRLGLV